MGLFKNIIIYIESGDGVYKIVIVFGVVVFFFSSVSLICDCIGFLL